MDKKYQIFISSTYIDLAEARAKVRDAILSMYHFPVGMELFGAANEEQWQIISETIDTSDYYLLIIGQRYGSIIPEGSSGAGISYTEKKFRYALEKGIPILAFLIDDDVAVKPGFVETQNRDKFEAFKTSVKTGRLVEWWQTPDDLAQKVTAALYKQILRTERPGWIRNGNGGGDSEAALQEIQELKEKNSSLNKELLDLTIKKQKTELEAAKIKSEWKNAIEFVSQLNKKDIEYLQRIKTKIQPSKQNIFNLAIKYGYCDQSGKITDEMQDVLDAICELNTVRLHARATGSATIIKN